MKRTFWMWILCCCILGNLSMNTMVVKATEVNENSQVGIFNEKEEDIPYFWGHYTKTVIKYYDIEDVIPNSIYYEEYRSDFGGTFSGTLSVVNITQMSNGWQLEVTYRGELYGHM